LLSVQAAGRQEGGNGCGDRNCYSNYDENEGPFT
jgi:hypothetical protein